MTEEKQKADIQRFKVRRGEEYLSIFINHDKRVVVAKLTVPTMNGLFEDFIGRATCDLRDTFNPQYGVQLAADRACIKYVGHELKWLEKKRKEISKHLFGMTSILQVKICGDEVIVG